MRVVNLAVAESPEETVVARLMEKLQTISDTIGDIEAILGATSGDSEEGGNAFESQIREMVMKSLAGQDVTAAAQFAEDSILAARKLLKSNQQQMDASLGDLSDLHKSGPSMPRLTPVLPTVGHEKFVKRTLSEEGFRVTAADGGMRGTFSAAPSAPPTRSPPRCRPTDGAQ